MSPPASSEFVNLCQTQLQLLAQSLGASLGVVYLTGDWSGNPNKAPLAVATYPEGVDPVPPESPWALPPRAMTDPLAQTLNHGHDAEARASTSSPQQPPAPTPDFAALEYSTPDNFTSEHSQPEPPSSDLLNSDPPNSDPQNSEHSPLESLQSDPLSPNFSQPESRRPDFPKPDFPRPESLGPDVSPAELPVLESLSPGVSAPDVPTPGVPTADAIAPDAVAPNAVIPDISRADPSKPEPVRSESLGIPVPNAGLGMSDIPVPSVSVPSITDPVPSDRAPCLTNTPDPDPPRSAALPFPDPLEFSPEKPSSPIAPVVLGAIAPAARLRPQAPATQWPPTWTPGLQHQVVLPLQQGNFVLGFLVVERAGQDWSDQDHRHLEQVARSLALACVLERRFQWMQERYHEQELIQEQQQDILDTLLHQIRNPLTALRTFGKLLLRRLQTEDPNRNVAENMVRESDRLNTLLQQLNQQAEHWSPVSPTVSPGTAADRSGDRFTVPSLAPGVDQLETAASAVPALLPSTPTWLAPHLQLEACDLQAVLAPLVAAAQARAEDQNRQIQLYLPPPPWPPVAANALALGEVLNNVVDNALKYTPEGGVIAVVVQQWSAHGPHGADGEAGGSITAGLESPGDLGDPQVGGWGAARSAVNRSAFEQPLPAPATWTEIIVSDTGPGIPAIDRPRLFERHYRGVQADGDIPGTGIGLAVVKELVEQMQGEVRVLSPAGDWSPLALARVPSSPLTASQASQPLQVSQSPPFPQPSPPQLSSPQPSLASSAPPSSAPPSALSPSPTPLNPMPPGTAFCFRFAHGSTAPVPREP